MQERNKTRHHGKIFFIFISVLLVASVLIGRLFYIMIIT